VKRQRGYQQETVLLQPEKVGREEAANDPVGQNSA